MKVQLQSIHWEARDLERDDGDSSHFVISAFGKTKDGQSVCVHTEFKPYFCIKNVSSDRAWLFSQKGSMYRPFHIPQGYLGI